MILKVARIGHPIVRTPARPLTRAEIRSADVQRLIDDMVDTMHEYEGVGLAAPQIHVGLRLAVIEVPGDDRRSENGVPLTVLVNPTITPIDDERIDGLEGCLSVPELRGMVPRLKRLKLDALDRQGKAWSLTAEDFFARVIQHECDHLDGNVYIDRMKDMKTLGFLQEFSRFAEHDEDDEDDEDDEGQD